MSRDNVSIRISAKDEASAVLERFRKSISASAKFVDDMTGSLVKQANQMGMSAKEFALYEASLAGATRQQKAQIASLYDHVEAQKREEAALQKALATREAHSRALQDYKKKKEAARQSIERMIDALAEEAWRIGRTEEEINLRKAAQMGATAEDLQAIKEKYRLIEANTLLAVQEGRLNKRLKTTGQVYTAQTSKIRNMRGNLGQLGFQVQDVAVQLQHGTNPLVVFGQQGSQVASIFGPGGAMIGALVAVGAALGSAFLPKLFEAKKELGELIEALDDSSVAYSELTKNAKALREFNMRTNYEDQVAELRDLGAEFGSLAAQRERAQKQIDSLSSERLLSETETQILASAESTMRNTEERFEQLGILLPAHAEEVSRLQRAYQDLENDTGDGHFLGGDDFAAGGGTALFDSLEAEQVFMQRYYDGLEEMRQQDLANRQTYADMQASVEASRVAMVKENDEQELQRLQQYADMQGEVEAARLEMLQERNEKEAEIQQEISEDMVARVADGLAPMNAALDAFASSASSSLMNFINGAGNAKEAIHGMANAITSGLLSAMIQMGVEAVKNKMLSDAIATASAASSVALATSSGSAIAAAMAPAAALTSLATSGANAAGAQAGISATLALAQGAALSSYEGGGYTGAGIRAGGLDGKGGHLAMVHPNETIIDHEKGGSAGNVNINFAITANDTKGFDQLINSRRGMFYNMVREALSDQGRRI